MYLSMSFTWEVDKQKEDGFWAEEVRGSCLKSSFGGRAAWLVLSARAVVKAKADGRESEINKKHA